MEAIYTEADLVAFGNYMAEKTRKQIQEMEVQVTHADLSNWQDAKTETV